MRPLSLGYLAIHLEAVAGNVLIVSILKNQFEGAGLSRIQVNRIYERLATANDGATDVIQGTYRPNRLDESALVIADLSKNFIITRSGFVSG